MARSSDASFPMSLFRDKAFHLRMIRRIALMATLFLVQSTLVLGVFYYSFLGKLVEGNAPLLFASEDMSGLGDAIPSMGSVLGWWLAVMLVINAIVTLTIGTYVLRKLSNPILAIKRALNEIGDGNLAVRLRSNDNQEFDELCVALNRALEQVNGKISEARQLTKIIDTLEDQPQPDEKAALKALEECRDVLRFFDPDKRANNDDVNEASKRQNR